MVNTDNYIEIYRQRYETFRHLDKLRWQMLQILVAIVSATALFLRFTTDSMEWWGYFLLGLALVVLGFILNKINIGIRNNGAVLKNVAEAIGDSGIPDVSNRWKSVAHWITVFVFISGLFLIFGSIWIGICDWRL